MRYRIISEMNGRLLREDACDDILLESTKQHAQDSVEKGLATRVEIRDQHQDDKLVFHYPRTVSKAP